MNISIQELKVYLADSQKAYIQEKIEHAVRYLGKLSQDDSVEAKIVIIKEDTKAEEDSFQCDVTLFLPHKHTLRSSVRAATPEAAIDIAEGKLKKQIEKLRTKLVS